MDHDDSDSVLTQASDPAEVPRAQIPEQRRPRAPRRLLEAPEFRQGVDGVTAIDSELTEANVLATTTWLGPSPEVVVKIKKRFVRTAATDMRNKDKGCWRYKHDLLALLYKRVGRFTDPEEDIVAREEARTRRVPWISVRKAVIRLKGKFASVRTAEEVVARYR